MFRSLRISSSELPSAGSALCLGNGIGRRFIRTQIPPRPNVTTITYLDHHGNVIKGKEETEISLVRTRENKFFLQRLYPNGTVLRFHCPGLQILKGATNFEYFSLSDVDHHGGVAVPHDIHPMPQHEPFPLLDAIFVINGCHQTKKFTRKDRRSWQRRLYAHWTESPEKFQITALFNLAIASFVALYFGSRYAWMWWNGKTWFEDIRPGDRVPTWAERTKSFGDRHPEHSAADVSPVSWSPAQHLLSQARSDMRGTEHQDTTGWSNDLMWKMRHAYFYRHWPASL